MSNRRFSSYGRALFELIGNDSSSLYRYEGALSDIEKDLADNPALYDVLSSYSLPKEQQFELVDKLYQRYGLKHLVPFLKLLISRHLIVRFAEVEQGYRKAVNEALGRSEGIVYSASLLSKEEVDELEKAMGKRLKKEVKLTNRVEPSLLGGVRIFIDDMSFDGTVESKIEKMRSSLLKTAKGGN